MKVELKTTIANQKVNLFTKFKRYIVAKLKPIPNDSFESTAIEAVGGKIISRKHPNWCDAPEDKFRNNTIARTRVYYPEDEEKMKTMTDQEKWDYKDQLDKEGKFYYDDNYGSTEILEEFLRSCGKTLDDVRIKDTQ